MRTIVTHHDKQVNNALGDFLPREEKSKWRLREVQFGSTVNSDEELPTSQPT